MAGFLFFFLSLLSDSDSLEFAHVNVIGDLLGSWLDSRPFKRGLVFLGRAI